MIGKKISIAAKLILGSATNIFLVACLAALTFWTVGQLRVMQDEGAEMAKSAVDITRASNLGAETYQIIADAEINRELAVTEKDWAGEKAKTDATLTKIAATASTDEQKKDAEKAKADYAAVVTVFEGEMMPALRANETLTPEIRAMDGKIDTLVATFAETMAQLRDVETKQAAALDADFDAAGSEGTTINLIVAGVAILMAFGTAWGLVRTITSPIRAITEAMRALAAGNKAIVVPGVDRKDEIGGMAGALQVFKDQALEVDRMQAAAQEAEKKAEQDKRRSMHALADGFQASVGEIVKSVAAASTQLQSTAQSLTATAEETSNQTTAVAAASEEAATNVQTVASAAEELSASVQEISRQVSDAAQTAAQAVGEAKKTDATIQGLSEAAQKIGNVVQLIADIASQTNLLALNATIEAARAGESGKGFAVVASEVKSLATQTARATEEIGGQIAAMQSVTNEAVSAIRVIGGTIEKISQISTAIASAVEEQGAATKEIARNVDQAAIGTKEVTRNIDGVSQAAVQTGQSANQVLTATRVLSQSASDMRTQIEEFLKKVKAA